jgi:predicted GNAT superfamily acetyltransferase
MHVRDACQDDYESIVCLNTQEEKLTSPMSLGRLQYLSNLSSFHKVAEIDGMIAAFILAIREGAPYENMNYAWFASRYDNFLYIDRVVVSQDFAGMKIGSYLYKHLFAFARSSEVSTVVCEYNIDPPNLASKAFHDKFGFKEVGTQYVAGSKLVSLQAVET